MSIERATSGASDSGVAGAAGTLAQTLAQTRSELHDLARRFDAVLSSLPVCVAVQDTALRYAWVRNPPAPLTSAEVVGRCDRELWPTFAAAVLTEAKEAVLSERGAKVVEIALAAPSETHAYEVRIEPYDDIDGRMVGVVSVMVDVTDRHQREQDLAQALREMSHRSRNQLAILLSVVRQTAGTTTTHDEFVRRFDMRAQALARTQDLLVANSWRSIDLARLIHEHVAARSPAPDRVLRISGPKVLVRPEPAQNLSLALHELAVNAAEMGSLSHPSGRLDIVWSYATVRDESPVVLRWSETNGPAVLPPRRRGFGCTMIERLLAHAIAGRVDLDFRPSGVRCEIEIPAQCLAR